METGTLPRAFWVYEKYSFSVQRGREEEVTCLLQQIRQTSSK